MFRCPICGESFESRSNLHMHWRHHANCRVLTNYRLMIAGLPRISDGRAIAHPPVITQAAAVAIALLVHMPIALYLISHLKG
ncbi:MAG: C2H2-type zinc finger protein [Lentisphaerae bacterium]|jgi:hypothetical protein|nr:C2H2-type zinc finger protein [Lentisphaerota bacterium]